MARVAVLLLLVVAIVYAAAYPNIPEDTQCGPNEEFKSCGSPCVDTCQKKASPVCVLRCQVGCQCKPGFVRNNDHQCVLTRDC